MVIFMKTTTIETMVSATLELTMTLSEAYALRTYLAEHNIQAKNIVTCHVIDKAPVLPDFEAKAEAPVVEKPQAEVKKDDKKAKSEDKKADKKPEPKKAESSDDFDRELYLALTARYGLTRKDGSCIKCFRDAIYDAMKYASIIKTGKNAGKVKIAKKVEKTILAELVALATKNGEAWAMDKALKAAEMVAA